MNKTLRFPVATFLIFLSCQTAQAEWVGPYKVDSVSVTGIGTGISVIVDGAAGLDGCPNIEINELVWSPAGIDRERESMVGDMLISSLMSAQAQGSSVLFDVSSPCSAAPASFGRVRISY